MRRKGGGGEGQLQTDNLQTEAPLGGSPFASLGPAGGEAGQVGGEECEVPACPLPAPLLLLSAFSSLSDSF